jgi:succinate dehydrogenase / fumarate reductase cytochrome b subunit
MSLTGIFLIVFLIVHLIGNLQLLIDDGGEAFNLYAKFMTTNPFIKFTSYGLYSFILIHAIQGWLLWSKNRKARGNQRYKVHKTRATNTVAGLASNMGWLGTIIFIFLLIHLWQFWFQMKIDALPYVEYDGESVKNLYAPVKEAFTNLGFVIFYLISMVVVGLHLLHGFASSFQTLGLNHVGGFGNIIRFLGKAYSIIVPAAFAIIPLWFYIKYAL